MKIIKKSLLLTTKLDLQTDKTFQDIIYLAANITNSPMAFINFVDGERLIYKYKVGHVGEDEGPFEGSFCQMAFLENDIFIVPDATSDERFSHKSYVKEGVQFYAGIPLVINHKDAVGILCICDTKPKILEQTQIDLLKILGRQIQRELELVISSQELKESRQKIIESEQKYKSVTQSIHDAIIACDEKGKIISWNKGAENIFGLTEAEAMNLPVSIIMPERFRALHHRGMERVSKLYDIDESQVIGKTIELVAVKKDVICEPCSCSR